MFAMIFLLALVIVLLLGPKTILFLAAAKARQPVSSDAPASHQKKQGTPTMGGLLIIAGAAAATLIGVWRATQSQSGGKAAAAVLAPLTVFVLAGGIGLLDDLGKARKKQNQAGLSERVKLGLQGLLAVGFALWLGLNEQQNLTTTLTVGAYSLYLGIFYYPLVVLYLCFFGNAVNFTDGLDGLSSGVSLIAALSLTLIGAVFLPEVGIFYAAVAGACAGFLWFNAHPARVFMGDTGSLALGMGLSAAAIVARQELLFLIVGGIYLIEIFSMMIQRYVFKYRRIRRGIEYAQANRVFRRAPLHHHFEELGWPETQVVLRFWIAALILAAIGLLLAPQMTGIKPG